jgi:hypothetical protein
VQRRSYYVKPAQASARKAALDAKLASWGNLARNNQSVGQSLYRSRRNTRGIPGRGRWRVKAGRDHGWIGGRRASVGVGEIGGSARFANVLKNPLISRGVHKTVCQSIQLINKKNFNPAPSSSESDANLPCRVHPRTDNHPAGLCEAGRGSRWRQGPSGRGGLRRGGAGRLPRARAVADRALGCRLSHDAGSRPGLQS